MPTPPRGGEARRGAGSRCSRGTEIDVSDSTYIPVPVEAAKAIAEQYQKDAVVVLSWDQAHQLTHTTTYGKSAFDKENAAAVGEICTKAIGCDLGKKQAFEDFHNDYDPARLREAEELLRMICRRQGTNPAMLQQIERWLRAGGDVVRRA